MHSINRDKLIVSLLADDIVEVLNQTMKEHHVTLLLDYSGKDHLIRLRARIGSAPLETWLLTNTRTKVCAHCEASSPYLQRFFNEAKDRLEALGGSLALVGFKPRQGPPLAKLQACVQGAHKIAVTLYGVPRGVCSSVIQSFTPMRHAA